MTINSINSINPHGVYGRVNAVSLYKGKDNTSRAQENPFASGANIDNIDSIFAPLKVSPSRGTGIIGDYQPNRSLLDIMA